MKDKKIKIILFFLFVIGICTAWLAAPSLPNRQFNQEFGLRNIELQISSSKLWKLKNQRDNAIASGILITGTGDWVNGELAEGKEKTKIEVRLKNDGSNHLKSDKWSFRVRTTDNKAWSGLRSFSLQSPEIKKYLDEWVFHLALQKAGVISPRYDFVRLFLNGKYLGIYAIEEHFSDELLYAQQKIVAPVFSFSDDSWSQFQAQKFRNKNNVPASFPFFGASEISTYDSKMQKTEKFKGWTQTGRILLNQYRFGSRDLNEIFDLSAMATAFAACTVFGNHSALVWQNQRFYFNPINEKLEPIISGTGIIEILNPPTGFYFGFENKDNHSLSSPYPIEMERFLANKNFMHLYYQKLMEMSHPDYLPRLLESLREKLRIRQSLIREESPFYKFDAKWILENAKQIRKNLESDLKFTQLQ